MASYSVGSLSDLIVTDLREICAKHNIRVGRKRKHELIDYMVQILNPTQSAESEFTELKSKIDSTFFATEPPQHTFYRTHFNGVDLHDRYWYKIPYNYQVRNWQTAYFFGILKVAVINSWVLHNEIEQITLEKYLTALAVYLLNLKK